MLDKKLGLFLLSAWVMLGGSACVDTVEDDDFECLGGACDAWDDENDPAHLGAFVYQLNQLPGFGEIEALPWPGSSWPMARGGTAWRWLGKSLPSPIEKYDAAFLGDNGTAAQWELENHSRSGVADHSLGWAAAALIEPEPSKAIEHNGVRFEISDIKALLSEAHRGDEVVIIGGPCQGALGPLDEEGRQAGHPCEGLNAGSFHVALANMIGLRQRGVVLNGTTLTAIVVGFTTVSGPELITVEDARLRLGDAVTTYPNNPEATSFFWVESSLRLMLEDATPPSALPRTSTAENLLIDWTASYVLEVNAEGAIVGGEWAHGPRPDMLWVPVPAVADDGGTGEPSENSNPHVTMDNLALLLRADVPEAPVESFVRITSPHPGQRTPNPVTFTFATSPDIVNVDIVQSEPVRTLNASPISASTGTFSATLEGEGRLHTVSVVGYNAQMEWLAASETTFTLREVETEPPGGGFNQYVLESIDDWSTFPRDETYRYCYGASCNNGVGMAIDATYMGQQLFEGSGTCYCSGHTLQIFLDAYRRYQEDRGIASNIGYGDLDVSAVDRGRFYIQWYGIDTAPSAGDAFFAFGIGEALEVVQWDEARAGDFVMLSRANRTGHAVIFMDWIREGSEIIGLRYYSCNGGGESQRDPDDPSNTTGVSGPSFQSERFVSAGGQVLPSYTFIGHPFDPSEL